VITRTEGVTASFLKELLRRAALRAADEAEPAVADRPPGAEPALRVTDAHLSAALDELLDAGNQLTRVLLGAPGRAPLGTDAVIPEQGHRPPRRPRP
jgi:hypothetical protein